MQGLQGGRLFVRDFLPGWGVSAKPQEASNLSSMSRHGISVGAKLKTPFHLHDALKPSKAWDAAFAATQLAPAAEGARGEEAEARAAGLLRRRVQVIVACESHGCGDMP